MQKMVTHCNDLGLKINPRIGRFKDVNFKNATTSPPAAPTSLLNITLTEEEEARSFAIEELYPLSAEDRREVEEAALEAKRVLKNEPNYNYYWFGGGREKWQDQNMDYYWNGGGREKRIDVYWNGGEKLLDNIVSSDGPVSNACPHFV